MRSRRTTRSKNRLVRSLALAGPIVGIGILGAATATAAQDLDGFAPEPGHGDVAFSLSFDSYDEFWVGTEKVSVPELGTVDTFSASLWWRHGLTERLTVVATVPYVDVEGDGTANLSDSGAQDLSAFLQYRIWSGAAGRTRHSFSVGVGGRTPVGDYEGDSPISLGDDTTDALLRAVWLVQAGRWYVSTQTGWDFRGDPAPNGLPLAVTAGRSFGNLTPSVTWYRYWADGGTDIGPGVPFPSNKDEFERFAAKVFARVTPRFGVAIGGFTTLDGRNSGDTDGYAVGLVYSY
ncbi:MAG TPA: transporter [Thermoanaerobaculia bacterium]|nr:transporter [Thermoanaerobaculia bacterium]